MPQKNNPFKPTQPVYSGMFAGRVDEIRRIETILFETKDCNPTNLLIVGERGIGKTSLLLFLRYLAIGEIPFNEGRFNFLPILVSLDKKTSIGELAKKMRTTLERQLRDSQDAIQYLKDIWGFIQRLEIGAVKIGVKPAETSGAEIFENFTYSIVDTVKAITSSEGATHKLGLFIQRTAS